MSDFNARHTIEVEIRDETAELTFAIGSDHVPFVDLLASLASILVLSSDRRILMEPDLISLFAARRNLAAFSR